MDHEHDTKSDDAATDDTQRPGMPPEDLGHVSEAKRGDDGGAAVGGSVGPGAGADNDAEEAAEESTQDPR